MTVTKSNQMASIDEDISSLRHQLRSLLGPKDPTKVVVKRPEILGMSLELPADTKREATDNDSVSISLLSARDEDTKLEATDNDSVTISLLSARDEDKKDRRRSASSPHGGPMFDSSPRQGLQTMNKDTGDDASSMLSYSTWGTYSTRQTSTVQSSRGRGRKATVPQAPKFALDAKYGQKVPSPSVKEDDGGDDDSSVFSYSTWGTRSTTRSTRTSTVPQPPMFQLDAKYGEKVPSPSVKGDDDQCSVMSFSTWGSRSTSRTPAASSPRFPLDIKDLSPSLPLDIKYGEKGQSPSVNSEDDISLWSFSTQSFSTRGSRSTNRTPTIPRSPRFALDAKYGEKVASTSTRVDDDDSVSLLTYSTYGSRSTNRTPTIPFPPRDKSSRKSLDGNESLRSSRSTTHKKKTLTVPQAPSFALDAKYGKKSLSTSSVRSEDGSHSSASTNSKTAPASPQFSMDKRFGKRHQLHNFDDESLASSSDNFFNSLRSKEETKSSWRPGRLTVPVAPKFHNLHHHEKPKSSEELELALQEHRQTRQRATADTRRKKRKKKPSGFTKSSLPNIAAVQPETIEEEGESEDERENQEAEGGSQSTTSKLNASNVLKSKHDPDFNSPPLKPLNRLVTAKEEGDEDRAVDSDKSTSPADENQEPPTDENQEPLSEAPLLSMEKDLSALRSRLRSIIDPVATDDTDEADKVDKEPNLESTGTMETVSSDSTDDNDSDCFGTVIKYNGVERPTVLRCNSAGKPGVASGERRGTTRLEDRSATEAPRTRRTSFGSTSQKVKPDAARNSAMCARSMSNPRGRASKDSIESALSPSVPRPARRRSDVYKKKNDTDLVSKRNRRRESDPATLRTSLKAYQTASKSTKSDVRPSKPSKEARNRRLTFPMERKKTCRPTVKSAAEMDAEEMRKQFKARKMPSFKTTSDVYRAPPVKSSAEMDAEEMRKQFRARKMPSFKNAPEIKPTKSAVYSSMKNKKTPPRHLSEGKRSTTRSSSVGRPQRHLQIPSPSTTRVKPGRKSFG